MEPQITKENLIELLRRALPEVEPGYQNLITGWTLERPPGAYTILGSILMPKLQEELAKGKVNDFLRRCSKFFEDVCRSGDDEAANVVWIRVFERLVFAPGELNLLWPILGPETRKVIRDAAHRWSDARRMMGRRDHLPEDNIPE